MSVKANALVLGVLLRGGEEEQRFTAATAPTPAPTFRADERLHATAAHPMRTPESIALRRSLRDRGPVVLARTQALRLTGSRVVSSSV